MQRWPHEAALSEAFRPTSQPEASWLASFSNLLFIAGLKATGTIVPGIDMMLNCVVVPYDCNVDKICCALCGCVFQSELLGKQQQSCLE